MSKQRPPLPSPWFPTRPLWGGKRRGGGMELEDSSSGEPGGGEVTENTEGSESPSPGHVLG